MHNPRGGSRGRGRGNFKGFRPKGGPKRQNQFNAEQQKWFFEFAQSKFDNQFGGLNFSGIASSKYDINEDFYCLKI